MIHILVIYISDSEGQGLWLGSGLQSDSWRLTLHKEDMEPQHLGQRLGLLLMVTQADMVC